MRKYLTAGLLALLAFLLTVLLLTGCGSGTSAACAPPNTTLSSELQGISEDMDGFVAGLAAEARPLTETESKQFVTFSYSVNDAVVTPGYVALEIVAGYGYDSPYGFLPADGETPTVYHLVYERQCSGDVYEQTSAKVSKVGASLAKPEPAKEIAA